jgi:hypothetical protein
MNFDQIKNYEFVTRCIISRAYVIQGVDLENIKAHVLRQCDFFGGFEFSFFPSICKTQILILEDKASIG